MTDCDVTNRNGFVTFFAAGTPARTKNRPAAALRGEMACDDSVDDDFASESLVTDDRLQSGLSFRYTGN